MELPEINPRDYKMMEPFPHWVGECIDKDLLERVLAEFPDLQERADMRFNNSWENKLAANRRTVFSPAAQELIQFCHSQKFLKWLSSFTGIKNLLADESLDGGGYHEIKRGGFLGMHVDFNRHAATGYYRRINLLIYLNKEWDAKKYKGGLWLQKKDYWIEKVVAPFFGTCVIFNTTNNSWHGHPELLVCPDNMSRKSFAFYYYTEIAPEGSRERHDTIFRKFRL